MIELVVVMAVMGILIAVAAPAWTQWREGLNSAKGVRSAYDALREARSKAITTNYQHMVRFDPPSGRFRVLKGTQAYGTPDVGWSTVVQDWTAMANGVTMTSGADGSSASTVDVKFNANGTAALETPGGTVVVAPDSTVTVCIRGGSGGNTKRILVSMSGRIVLQ